MDTVTYFELIWFDSSMFSWPHFVNQFSIRLGQLSMCPENIVVVDFFDELVGEEVFRQFRYIGKTLKGRVHKTSIAQILETA